MTSSLADLAPFIAERFDARRAASEAFFPLVARRVADASREMAQRFDRGGRLIAFGKGPYATDAQHVAVEFVHPVIVGKPALPAIDISTAFATWLRAIIRPDDMVMGFAPPGGDPDVDEALRMVHSMGAQTFALAGNWGGFAVMEGTTDAFLQQELSEILYHTLWETVHVFLEHRGTEHDTGSSGFLYPFLSGLATDDGALLEDVATSIEAKAREVEHLRDALEERHAEHLAAFAAAIDSRIESGGKLILFGNGGSATDANDLALDCAMPPPGRPTFPAVSLSMDPACLSGIANDVGMDLSFLRQLIALADAADVAIGFSTSGDSRNVIEALIEARRRGLVTAAFVGGGGGTIVKRALADFSFVVPTDYVPRIQEVHASAYHILLECLYTLHDARE